MSKLLLFGFYFSQLKEYKLELRFHLDLHHMIKVSPENINYRVDIYKQGESYCFNIDKWMSNKKNSIVIILSEEYLEENVSSFVYFYWVINNFLFNKI